MRQIDIYKKALRILERAEVSPCSKSLCGYWMVESYLFWGICPLIRDITSDDSGVLSRFKRDSEKILGRELDEGDFWFTEIDTDEPKARSERLEHLKKLIKLYEDGN